MSTLAPVLRRAKSPVVFDAIRDIAPMALAVIPIGLTVGASAAASPISGLAGWLGGPLIVAGSVHIAVISLLSTGASAVVVILAALAIGARFAAYSAAKAAVIGLSRALATDFGVDGVTVNVVAPGLTRTDTAIQQTDESMFTISRRRSFIRMAMRSP